MTSKKEKLIELLRGSISRWNSLPEEILKEDIFDETGHVDLEFMTTILGFIADLASLTSGVHKALNHLLGCDEEDVKVNAEDKGGEKWPTEKILQNCKWDGELLTLPDVKFTKKAYLEAKRWIEGTGGRWNTSRQGFTWEFDANRVVGILLQGKRYDLYQEFQFFATPDRIADLVASKFSSLSADMRILEPSAGRGSLVKAIRRRCPDAVVDCFELMPENVPLLEKVEGARIIGLDFKDCHAMYDRIIANPPFSNNQDIDHVYMMYDHLKTYGEMAVITSPHWKFAYDKKSQYFRSWLKDREAVVFDIDRGEFKESGVSIPTVLLFIVRKP